MLRATGSPVHLCLKAALDARAGLATTDVVMMEVLAGAKDRAERNQLRRLLYGNRFLGVDGPADYESAAELFRLCRRGGKTPRQLTDCLIAIVAMRHDVELLSCDTDFQVIARHAPLRLAAASATGSV